MLTRCNGFAIIKRRSGVFLLIEPHADGSHTAHCEATLTAVVARALMMEPGESRVWAPQPSIA